ncbi:MAG: COX15/CtaA family protein [Xanthomonadales bacterium]|nr:COX15/CtaA family protein [Xanthomonadales bacterium]
MSKGFFRRWALATVVLTLAVIVLGAYVRLNHAGLGCPDWPGCYGHITWPNQQHEVDHAESIWPERPVEAPKAAKEMAHRYLVGILGPMIVVLAVLAWRRRREPNQPWLIPLLAVAVVIFQAVLGMWTVTWKLKPIVVTAHLLGGMSTFALLFWTWLRVRTWPPSVLRPVALRPWIILGLVLVGIQIALGGWVSTNYAALACPDFPTCQGSWWPALDFREAFILWRGIGVDYEGGVLDGPARAAIHIVHRIGALVVCAYLLWLGWRLWRSGGRGWVALLIGLLLLQISLGIGNVIFGLPLPLATAHNGVAALLLGCLLALLAASRAERLPS